MWQLLIRGGSQGWKNVSPLIICPVKELAAKWEDLTECGREQGI